jgi:hypothetical protein
MSGTCFPGERRRMDLTQRRKGAKGKGPISRKGAKKEESQYTFFFASLRFCARPAKPYHDGSALSWPPARG